MSVLAVLFAIAQPAIVSAQEDHPARKPPSSTYPVNAPQRPDSNGSLAEEQQPHVIVTLPAPAPIPWTAHERISWAVYLILAILGYAFMMVAVSTLKKIERNTVAAEAAARSATEIAQSALLHAQSILNAERPWLLINVEPTLGVENSFNITATNRGRSPGIITAALDQVVFAADDSLLPPVSRLKSGTPNVPFSPIILLPGEYASIRSVKRDDALELSGSEEKFKDIETWIDRIYLCGKIVYNDLIAPDGHEAHETSWCCWYIHGRQKSGLVIAGPPEYHAHT